MRGLGHSLRFRFAGLVVLLVAPGCAIEHPSLTSSSASKMPWLSFQVAPAKKDTKNYQRGIAQGTADHAVVKPALSTSTAKKEVRWPELRLPGTKREALTLPRTDEDDRLPQTTPVRTAQAEHIEFD